MWIIILAIAAVVGMGAYNSQQDVVVEQSIQRTQVIKASINQKTDQVKIAKIITVKKVTELQDDNKIEITDLTKTRNGQ
ncbi:MAG: hypothetical protein COB50_05440 [Thiotrichales bacterium]|nr:MAG: hypothetical protein COB50_05440 [Thiotrichales bacterium]